MNTVPGQRVEVFYGEDMRWPVPRSAGTSGPQAKAAGNSLGRTRISLHPHFGLGVVTFWKTLIADSAAGEVDALGAKLHDGGDRDREAVRHRTESGMVRSAILDRLEIGEDGADVGALRRRIPACRVAGEQTLRQRFRQRFDRVLLRQRAKRRRVGVGAGSGAADRVAARAIRGRSVSPRCWNAVAASCAAGTLDDRRQAHAIAAISTRVEARPHRFAHRGVARAATIRGSYRATYFPTVAFRR